MSHITSFVKNPAMLHTACGTKLDAPYHTVSRVFSNGFLCSLAFFD